MPTAGIPSTPSPPTVANYENDPHAVQVSLDDAIRLALENSEVIRVLAGEIAVNSGRTIYDAAITNTGIDQERGRFDPAAQWNHNFNNVETPFGVIAPEAIAGTRTTDYDMDLGVSKTTQTGGTFNFGVNANQSRTRPDFALSPENRHSLDLSYTQPLFRGGGLRANRAPIVIARIDTERSYFQYKDSVQELVRGVIAAYWALVFARTDQWARQQQVQQAEFAYQQARGRQEAGITSRGVVAQARVSLGNFKASLTAARNNVLQREAALRNLLGLPPADGKRIVPVTPPTADRVEFDWQKLIGLAEQMRPDIIELKLIVEADEQRVLLARNQANPTVDANMLYRWNGLDGRTPSGARLSTQGGQFTDWTLGVNFSVPLSLRQERAVLRRQELIVARDLANLRQGLHNATHILATSLRNLDQFHEQYQEFRAIREEARLNLQERRARWRAGGVGGISYVDLLLAITDWGNTISSEAQALSQYNTELANIERESGTILETHGVRFYEERLDSIGPLGKLGPKKYYPASVPPSSNVERYPRQDEPAEDFFELDDPLLDRPQPEELPIPPQPRSTPRTRPAVHQQPAHSSATSRKLPYINTR